MAVELQPELALKERLQKHSELTDVAREVLQILSSDDLLQKSKDSSETVEKISSKVRKGKENTTSTIESRYMYSEKSCLVGDLLEGGLARQKDMFDTLAL